MKKLSKKEALKKQYDAYNNKLYDAYKSTIDKRSGLVNYFNIYLRYLRDYYILKAKEESSTRLMTLVLAINELERYESCMYKYFAIPGKPAPVNIENMTEEDRQKKYQEEKEFHWTNFWGLVKDNIDTWEATNDSF